MADKKPLKTLPKIEIHPDKGAPEAPLSFEEVHQKACENRHQSYVDPVTGYVVMTGYYLRERGYCCHNGCRHCPYEK